MLKSLILKLDGVHPGRRTALFHTLPCAIRSAPCPGGNVQLGVKGNYRMSETLFSPR